MKAKFPSLPCCTSGKGNYYPREEFCMWWSSCSNNAGIHNHFPEGLIFSPAKCTLRWGGLIHRNPGFVVPHLTILWINSLALCFGKKYLLLRVIPALCSKSRAELSSSSGWRICLEIVPTLDWNCFNGWDLVALVSCNLLEAVIGKPHLSLSFLLIKAFLLNFH